MKLNKKKLNSKLIIHINITINLNLMNQIIINRKNN
jgi:hypothetical protein